MKNLNTWMVLNIYDKVQYQLLKEHFFNLNIQHTVSNKIQTRKVTQKKLITIPSKNKYGERTSVYMIRLINDLDYKFRSELNEFNIKHLSRPIYLNLFDLAVQIVFVLCFIALAAANPQLLTWPGIVAPVAPRTVVAGPTVVNGLHGNRFVYPGSITTGFI
ncbi:unnamed protein product [Parnassius mnemosyne]|uniref:Uncharacterized protein n=1 Tax=Parnassius mnemosyne TaxID=213953 RepID=A0AAV1KKQ0_9NEOP